MHIRQASSSIPSSRRTHHIIICATPSDSNGHESPRRQSKRGKVLRNVLRIDTISKLQSYILPPIRPQDTSQMKWYEIFRPKSMAREALLGTRIMMRLYCPLVLIGFTFEKLSCLLPTLPLVLVDSLSPQSPLHAMEGVAKHMLLARLPPLSFAFRLTVLGPIFEEVAYRGVGFLITYWDAWFMLLAFSAVAGLSPLLSAFWALYIYAINLNDIVPLLMRNRPPGPLLEIVKSCWLSVVPIFFQLPLLARILQLSRRSQKIQQKGGDEQQENLVTSAHDATSDNSSRNGDGATKCTIPEAHKRRCLRIVNRATRGKRIDPAEESALACEIQKVLLRMTRWKTSALFAAAHVPFKGALVDGAQVLFDSGDHYVYLRKFLGVFCSSFLVESRLVACRGTIWGACGAHMCFNTLTMCRLATEIVVLEYFASTSAIIPGVLVTPAGIVVLQLVLLRLDKWMALLEKNLTTHIR